MVPEAPSPGGVMELDASNFDNELLKPLPLVVDFYATWCGPCQRFAPVMDEAARQLAGKARFARVDGDLNGGLVHRFGVTCYPTVIVFKNGVAAGGFTGGRDLEAVKQAVDSAR